MCEIASVFNGLVGLLPENSPAVAAVYDRRTDGADTAPLQENERPFRLWAKHDGDFAKAVVLIPANWPKPRRALCEARLTAIRDNEHIRRIEQRAAGANPAVAGVD